MSNPVYRYIKNMICKQFLNNIFKQAKDHLFTHS